MTARSESILILDFGSQVTQLIARRVRELGVYCELHPFDWPEEEIRRFAPRGIILSGGPESVAVAGSPRAPEIVFSMGVPVLGICYGMQTMAHQLGGKVRAAAEREFGFAAVTIPHPDELLAGIEDHMDSNGLATLEVWMSHGDQVLELPPGFASTATTTSCGIAAMSDAKRRFFGLQFHPEVTHTRQGKRLLSRFVRDLCRCEATWTPDRIIAEQVALCKARVGREEVILGLSGGVDSAVTAALLHRALGSQLTCIFVDNGLLRLHEAEQVRTTFQKHLGMKFIQVDAEKEFLESLEGVIDPEEKRRRIGHAFISVFEREAKKIEGAAWLAQGTIYPDVIESAGGATGKAHKIKSHHNVGGLPDKMALKLLEPLRDLFKDEVRAVGLELGLPHDLVFRHPFPGPGLSVRILGEVRKDRADLLRQADDIFLEELHRHRLYHEVNQAFAVLLPVQSVGVLGDARHYAPVIALRAVETTDFMTARWARLPADFLELVSQRIVNEIRGVSRVVYDITGKPPATIEWE